MTNDLVSDMLTRIRNSSMARHTYVRVRYSKLNLAILKVLETESYIDSYVIEEENNPKQNIKVFLKYKGWWIKKPLFSTLKELVNREDEFFVVIKIFPKLIDTLRFKQGTAIISTSNGVMSHSKATKLKKGGEILCYIG